MKRMLLITATLSALAGCASIENPGKKIPAIPSAPINTYSVGDAFVYSDGYVEEVISTSPNEISWALGPMATVATRTVNFFDPTIHWQMSGSTYKFAKSSQAGSLWPMQEGAAESLIGQMTVEHRNGSQSFDQTWSCNVSHSERLDLSSGSFDTFVVDCRRQSESGAHWQRRRFNYAPTLGHYVRVIEEMRAHGYPGYVFKQRDLVYYRVKNSVQFTSTFQKSLGTLNSGQSFDAENNGLTYTAEIRSTSMNEAQIVCRELQVRDERSESYRADYCLTSGFWSLRSMKNPQKLP
jgi:hypothetical protein